MIAHQITRYTTAMLNHSILIQPRCRLYTIYFWVLKAVKFQGFESKCWNRWQRGRGIYCISCQQTVFQWARRLNAEPSTNQLHYFTRLHRHWNEPLQRRPWICPLDFAAKILPSSFAARFQDHRSACLAPPHRRCKWRAFFFSYEEEAHVTYQITFSDPILLEAQIFLFPDILSYSNFAKRYF